MTQVLPFENKLGTSSMHNKWAISKATHVSSKQIVLLNSLVFIALTVNCFLKKTQPFGWVFRVAEARLY